MTPSGKKLGALALAMAAALIWLLPTASQAGGAPTTLDALLLQTTNQLGQTLQQSLDDTERLLREAEQALLGKNGNGRQASPRATATDPQTQPPLHGTNPHGQGSVVVGDVSPSPERPLGGNPNGSNAGPEEIVVGRARGEKDGAGNFHGHITILALLGSEILGVDTNEGETKSGPLQAVQDAVLDPVCAGVGACLGVLTANSTTTSSGSTNEFSVASATVGGLNVGVASSKGSISEDANCQTSFGEARTANVGIDLSAVATVANSSSTSKSCRNQAPQTVNTSTVIGLGGVAVPLPAAGCANGTPDTVAGINPLLPVICHANEVLGATAVREALDVFVLSLGDTALLKESTAASESVSVAPAGPEDGGPECSDGADNDGDGVIDADDPGCHTDGDPDNPNSYDPNDDDESNGGGDTDPDGDSGTPECSDGVDNDGDGVSDENDPGCHSDGNPNNPDSFNPNDDDESNGGGSGRPECSDGVDNDGDGVSDARDPGCHTDGNPNNPNSYNPNDDDESNGGINAGTLPFTGTDLTGLMLAGLLLLAGGLLIRRREA